MLASVLAALFSNTTRDLEVNNLTDCSRKIKGRAQLTVHLAKEDVTLADKYCFSQKVLCESITVIQFP